MKERPILFSAPMVRAILEGRKTQTRRLVKPQPSDDWHPESVGMYAPLRVNGRGEEYPGKEVYGAADEDEGRVCRYGMPGDRLWVKETWTGTWHPTRQCDTHILVEYAADGSEAFQNAPEDYALPKAAQKVGNWVTPLFMPRWASRLLLENMAIRVERLQEISEEDAIAEGCEMDGVFPKEQPHPRGGFIGWDDARQWYAWLWEEINGAGSWDANPFVWTVNFNRVSD